MNAHLKNVFFITPRVFQPLYRELAMWMERDFIGAVGDYRRRVKCLVGRHIGLKEGRSYVVLYYYRLLQSATSNGGCSVN